MKQLLLLLSFFLSITTLSVGQKLNFSIGRPTIKAIDSIELSKGGRSFYYNGITFKVSSGYFPDSDRYKLGQPIASTRGTAPLKTLLNYYYSLPDSTLRLIEYTWNTTDDNVSFLKDIFEHNTKEFSGIFKSKGESKNEDHDGWSQKTITWENEKAYVEQFIVTGSSTHRVRVLISWK